MVSHIRIVQAVVNRLGSGPEIPAFLFAVGSLFIAVICAVCGFDIAAVVFILISVIGEYFFDRDSPSASTLLNQAAFGMPTRFALRIIAALVAGSRLESASSMRALILIGIGYILVLSGRALHKEYRRVGPLKPMESRNIPGDPRIGVEPTEHMVLVVVTQIAVIGPAVLQAPWWLVAILGAIAIAALSFVTVPEAKGSWAMRQQKRETGFTGPLRQVQEFIDDYRPEVLVHLSGPESADYQINTWIESLESLEQNVLIILRDPKLFARLGDTTIPALQLRNAGELMMLDLAPVKIALFPTNTGNNIHILRLPNIMSGFIGHGDSDKSASNNAFARGYDELWVAGEAGADRYRKANLGFHEGHYRFVGRPQVHPINKTPRLGDEDIPTILYAPTWEGVNLEQEYSSVLAVGAEIVQKLIEADPPVRVIYKPHPFTGRRDAKYRVSHNRIVALIEQANRSKGAKHRVILGAPDEPTINDCFNMATGLISDISSVVSDFLASEKPYAVFDHTGSAVADFVAEFPSTGAATVIGRDGSGIEEFITVVTRSAPDSKAEARSRLATYLLGTADQRTLGAFQKSVSAFIARSDIDRADYRAAPQLAPDEAELGEE